MKVQIASIEYALPEKCVTNDELHRLHPEWSIHEIAKRTGVITRFVCQDGETALDLAKTACEKLFDNEAVAREDVGAIIVCTQTPDYIMPPNSTLLQESLGLPNSVLAFDFNLACSGFIYGLFMGKAMIESQGIDNILLVTAETYSKHINPGDRGTMALFGDGAAVTLLRKGERGLDDFVLGTDGSGANQFIVKSGGARIPKNETTGAEEMDSRGNLRTLDNIYMDGPAVMSFVKKRVPGCVNELLQKGGLSNDDISLFVFHQASGLSLDYLEKELDIPHQKMFRNLSRVGNTVSASLPIAIKDAQTEGLVQPGSRMMLVGFGVGYSWGACTLEW